MGGRDTQSKAAAEVGAEGGVPTCVFPLCLRDPGQFFVKLWGWGDRKRGSHHRQSSTLPPASAKGVDPFSRHGGGGGREQLPQAVASSKRELGEPK